jgi:hypothetical protein
VVELVESKLFIAFVGYIHNIRVSYKGIPVWQNQLVQAMLIEVMRADPLR